LQLSFWSIIIYVGIQAFQVVQDPEPVDLEAFVRAWSFTTSLLVVLGGGGGLLVAFATKHADAVLKSMATSFALIVVVSAEMLFLGGPADPVVCLSSGIAALSLQAYSEAPTLPEDLVVERRREERPRTADYARVPIGATSDEGEELRGVAWREASDTEPGS